MSDFDDRMRRAATGLRGATATIPPPSVDVHAPIVRRRRYVAVLAAATATAAVVLAALLVNHAHSSSTRPTSPSTPTTGTLPALLPSGLKLPAHWFLASADTTIAVVRGSGPVHRLIIWRPATVIDARNGKPSPAPYAIGGFFYGHPDLLVTTGAVAELGDRPFGHATVHVRATAPRCGSQRCVLLAMDGKTPLRLAAGRALDVYFGPVYGQPLVILVESSSNSLTQARAAIKPVLRQLSWSTD